MFDNSYSEVKPRRHFRASDAAHFMFTGLVLLCSAHLFFASPACDKYGIWNTVLFFGSLIWMVYLVLTLVVQFANKGTRMFLGYLDYLFILFHLVMGIWAWFFFNDINNSGCAPRWPFWVTIYRIFTLIALLAFVAVVFMTVLRFIRKSMNKKEPVGTYIEGNYVELD